ncbi:isopentenyl-diphosphate Delta-isomerase [Saccharopolyspora griseoalba]|uniref:Isopentenyl-diphosphate Delta-isomerase n=1 Tax=Saccharopolyspora griseoalba TaxID=1431848 RepID=A0ABW2LQT7_9PSEU
MEQVVLLDETGEAIGVEDKATVHHRQTPLHLAFSCYVFNDRGEFLLTQRAHHKRTFPSVWTNTCCGHPAPEEEMKAAITRRLGEELGLRVRGLELVLPGFRYRAEMDDVVENEMCPVFVAFTSDSPSPNPDEVAETRWVAWPEFSAGVLSGDVEVSPWCRLQVAELAELGEDPSWWPTGAPVQLPPAAQVA